jgi:hypothetical protein
MMAADAQPIESAHRIKKLKETCGAKLGLAGGFVLIENADGSFTITRWNLSRRCADLQEVSAFVDQVCTRS